MSDNNHPYRPLYNEADMKITYTFTLKEIQTALVEWLEREGYEVPDEMEISWKRDSNGPVVAGISLSGVKA